MSAPDEFRHEPDVFDEVRECRQAITALTRLVVENQVATIAAIQEAQQANLALLQQILAAVQPAEIAAIRFGWDGNVTTYPAPTDPNEVIIMSDFNLPDTDSATGTIAPVDAAGNAITGGAAPTWSTDVSTFVTLAVAADGMSATATPVDGAGVGVTNVTVTLTNADGTTFTGTSSVTTELTDAASASISWADDGVITPTPAPAPVPTDNPPADTPPAA